jgi:hypothetical protein
MFYGWRVSVRMSDMMGDASQLEVSGGHCIANETNGADQSG